MSKALVSEQESNSMEPAVKEEPVWLTESQLIGAGGGFKGTLTSLFVGEEGGPHGPPPTTLALGEEGGPHGPPPTTLALGEEAGP